MNVSRISTQDIPKTLSKKVTKPIQQTLNTATNELPADTFVKAETKKTNPIKQVANRIFVDSIMFVGIFAFMCALKIMKHRK